MRHDTTSSTEQTSICWHTFIRTRSTEPCGNWCGDETTWSFELLDKVTARQPRCGLFVSRQIAVGAEHTCTNNYTQIHTRELGVCKRAQAPGAYVHTVSASKSLRVPVIAERADIAPATLRPMCRQWIPNPLIQIIWGSVCITKTPLTLHSTTSTPHGWFKTFIRNDISWATTPQHQSSR